MQREQPVSNIMTADPVTVTPDQALSSVRHLLEERRIHHVPVVERGRFIGLVSSTDIFRMSFGNLYAQDDQQIDSLLDTYTIRDAMQEDVLTIQRGATVREAAERLCTGAFHALPVLDGERLVGMVTSTDLIRCLLKD